MRSLGWLAVVASAVALAACGSKAKSASVTSTAQPAPGAPAQTTPATTTAATTTTSPPAGGGTEAPKTRTATEPAFTSQPSSAEGLNAASATVRARGFEVVNTSDYHPAQTLRVLVGRRAASGDGSAQSAFFFVNGRYIGTDAIEPSATVRVASQNDTEVTLAYALYSASDAVCCPSGGQAHVRFQLNNGKLVALDPIPPVHSSARLSRR